MKRKIIPQFVLFKNCSICKQEKLTSEFNKQKSTPDGLQNICRECVSNKKKEQWRNNPEYRKKITETAVNWYQENKPHILSRNREYIKNYNSEPCHRIIGNLRKKLEGKTKFKSPIGLKAKELKVYIESHFQEGMTWENYGKNWYISRIRPISDFDLNDSGEVAKINHYTNLKVSFSPKIQKSMGVLNPKEFIFEKNQPTST